MYDNGFLKCPKCGSQDRFEISCTTLATISDEGVEDHGDMAYEKDSYCRCRHCGHEATVGDFTPKEPK
jgi:DNA-directed RNA polymerase subunit RPC12/RpoP